MEQGNFEISDRSLASEILISSAPLTKNIEVESDGNYARWTLIPKDHMLICVGDPDDLSRVTDVRVRPINTPAAFAPPSAVSTTVFDSKSWKFGHSTSMGALDCPQSAAKELPATRYSLQSKIVVKSVSYSSALPLQYDHESELKRPPPCVAAKLLQAYAGKEPEQPPVREVNPSRGLSPKKPSVDLQFKIREKLSSLWSFRGHNGSV